jgi:hypothetical protein
MTDAQKLADAFVKVVTEWATPAELAEIKRRNAKDAEYGSACATHDFFDANEAMAEAFTEAFGRDPVLRFDPEETADVALWNAAWDLAKAQGLTAHDA